MTNQIQTITRTVSALQLSLKYRALKGICLLIILFLANITVASAATRTWQLTGGGSWNTAINWSGSTIPQPNDDVVINLSVTGTISNVPSLVLNSITIGGTQNLTLTGTAGSTITINNLTATSALSITAGRTLTLGGATAATVVNIIFQTISTPTLILGNFINTANNSITVNSSQTLTIGGVFTANTGTISVDGSISNSGTITGLATSLKFNGGSSYNHIQNGGIIPTATWNASSNCNIIGNTGNTVPTGLGQGFGNFTWNWTTQNGLVDLGGALSSVAGNLTILSTNTQNLSLTQNTTFTLNIGGDLLLSSGKLLLSRGNGVTTLNVAGNYVHTGGTLDMGSGTVASIFNLSGDFTLNNAVALITESGSGSGTFNFNKTGTQNFTNTAGTISNIINFAVLNGSTLNLGSSIISSAGTFTLNAGATLNMGNANGITLVGNASGNIQTTTARVFNTGATYVYNGTLSQVTGNGLPATINKLIINNNNGVSLTQPLTVSGTLNLNGGVLKVGNNNLTISNTIGISAISGTFSAASMIETNGTGFLLISSNTNNNSFNGTYPIGNGSYYEPAIISGLANIAAAARTFSIRSVPTNPAIFGNGINKYWDLTGTLNITGTPASIFFQYNPAETTGDPTVLRPYNNISGSWQLAAGASNAGINPMTSTGVVNFAGLWTAGSSNTYYSYQSGDWNTALTWTTDPSGTLSINPGVPGLLDNVVILNGRTVNITSNGKQIGSLEIKLGGYLDLTNTNGHTFGTVIGQGVLRLSSGNFPAGSFSSFVASTGGTVEYYNFTGTLSTSQITYNHLLLTKTDNTATSYVMTLASDITLNGNMIINKTMGSGTITFTIGNNTTVRNIIINGNLLNSNAGCLINTPNANVIHNLSINGDFTNYGTVNFTNQVAANYTAVTATGAVNISFLGYQNSIVNCNGITNFYRIIVNKGTDMTYMVSLNASVAANFNLYGPCNYSDPRPGVLTGSPYSLSIFSGTARIGSNIDIHLAENTQYMIYQNCQLWVDGGHVIVPANCNQLGVTGEFRITAGSADCQGTGGIHLNNVGGVIQIDGGQLNARILRTSMSGGNQLGAYKQSGGTVVLDGTIGLPGSTFSRLAWWRPENQFVMSGGTLIVRDAGTSSPANGGIDIMSYPGNVQITGGTIIAEINDGRDFVINSTAPIYNLQLIRTAGATGNFTLNSINNENAGAAPFVAITQQPLVILNDLRLGVDGGSLPVTLTTNNANVTVGRNFVLGAGSTFFPGTNNLIFNGTSGQVFTNTGIINPSLNNLVITNSSNTNITNNLTIAGTLTINNGNCYFNDQGNSVLVAGNILNSGTHTSQANGSIILNGAGAQTIGGNGSGVFGNLGINKTTGTATFTANQSVTSTIRLANGILDINQYNLALSPAGNIYDALAGTTVAFGNTKMITLSGMTSDGGVTKAYNAIGTFLFPIGTSGGYRPATVGFSQSPTTWGSVNIKMGARIHPLTTSTNALKYYWKVSSTGFTGLQPNSVSHSYHFINPGDLNAGSLNNYIPAVYNPSSWTTINDVSQVDKINFNVKFNNVNSIDGEYTAGQIDAFGAVNIFYSRKTIGNWSDNDMWSTDPLLKWNGAACNCFPTAANIVIIGDGSLYNHNVTVTAVTGAINVGALTINSGSVLDLGTTTGHNFGVLPDQKVTGSGTLRISSSVTNAVFPSGDFGNFLNINGGTVEFYSNATTGISPMNLPTTYSVGITPVNLTHYNNLNSNAGTGKIIAMPNLAGASLTVYGNFTTNGTGLSEFCTQNTTQTMTVNGNVNVSSGKLEFINTNAAAQNNLVANADIIVSSGATFDVAATNTAISNITIQGNLVNNGLFNMQIGTPCNVTFTGAQNKGISGSGTTTNFNILTVNKGVDRNSILNVTSAAFSLNAGLPTALTLTNGTFRLSSSLPITLTTSAAFTIPESGCLSANGGTINIGQANNNVSDLLLQGRLEILAGAVNIGNGSGSNNDIEYASSGNPEIIISGGTLTVDGQIRRDLFNTIGTLWYTQSGGTLKVRGLAFDNTRSMFEVTNSGSQFNMSGGTLNIERSCGIGATYADVYIVPGQNTVTGGIVLFGNANSPAGQSFTLNTSAPLGNITVDGTTQNKTVSLVVNSLTLLNDLIINGNGSVFNGNGFNVTIGRNLSNNNTSSVTGFSSGGYQSGNSTQVTTFNGSSPAIISGTGTNLTNFSNLVIGSSSSVSLNVNTNVAVNTNLKLNSGTLADGGNILTVYGNIVNNAIHSSSGGNGIVMAGSQQQIISGSGSGIFGNVAINNANGVDMVDNTTINGNLTLTNGVFYIDDYKLTLGTSANVTTASTFGVNRMIALNGVISDQGVLKMFSGSSPSFTFPIGVAGKYTPAVYSITSSNAGTLKLLPVNQDNPSEINAVGDELGYYWKVVTTGFSGLTAATQSYSYITSDVTGNETLYHGARYNNSIWTDFGTSAINTSSTPHTLNVSGNFLDGEYTAGITANFGLVHSLYSLKSGNWNDPTVWAQDLPTNSTCNCFPSGNPVYIQPGHVITMTSNGAYAYSVDISTTAVLDMADKLYNSLGFITGTGRIKLKGTISGSYIFPGGNYDAFMADPTGKSTIEFYGTIPATLPLKPGNIYKPFQNVVCSDAGTKYMSAENMKVLKDLTINNGASLNNTLQNKNLYILGNWTDNNVTTSGFVPGTGLVSFEGTTLQQLTIVNNLTENFYDFRINNPSGMNLSGGTGDAQVTDYLYLTNGVIHTNTTNTFTITNTYPGAAIGGNITSFIDGPLYKAINTGSYFSFPVGNGSRFGNVGLSNVTASGTYVAQYFNNVSAYNIAKFLTPITWVSNNEYWWLSSSVASQGNIIARWDGLSFDPSYDRTKLRVVEWNPLAAPAAQWESQGGILADGGPATGTVQTSSPVDLSPLANQHYCTISTEGKPTATVLSPLYAAVICNNATDVATVQVKLTGTGPWSLSYTLNGVLTTLTNQASSPVNIVINSASPGINNVAGTYNFQLTGITDNNGTVGTIDTHTVQITVYAVPAPSITGLTTVGTSQAGVTYSTPAVVGDAYVWTVTGGTIASGQTTNAIIVNWGVTAGPFLVTVKETNLNGCFTTKSSTVNIVNAPVPNVTGNVNVCANEAGDVYQTPYISTHSYVWTVTGGTFTGPVNVGGFNQITVNWGTTPGPGTVTVQETFGSTIGNTLNVTINALPLSAPTVSDISICSGAGAILALTGAEGASDYYIYNGATQLVTEHTTTAGNYSFPSFSPPVTTTYTVKVVNQYGCTVNLISTPTVTVKPTPVTGPVFHKTN